MGGRGSSSKKRIRSKEERFEDLIGSDYGTENSFFGVFNQGDNDKWYDSLSQFEKLNINSYTGNKYKDINKYLRNPDVFEESDSYKKELRRQANDIQAAITKVPLQKSIVVHRYDDGGFLGKNISEVEVGKTITSKQFISTSTRRQTGFGHIGYDIRIRKGSKAGQYIGGMSKFGSEKEFLLKYGAKFKITGFSKDSYGNSVVQMEYID